MADRPIVVLNKEQLGGLKTNIAELDRIIKNADALIETGVMTPADLVQVKQTRAIAQNTLDAFKPSEP